MSHMPLSETALRNRRKKLIFVWALAGIACVVPVTMRIGGIAPMLAAGCCFALAAINIFLVVGRQSTLTDCSDISPDAMRQSHYGENDEQPLGKAKPFNDGWEPGKKY